MVEIWLQDNLLSGTVPATLAQLPDLESFYIDGNKITGTIPLSICRMELNKGFFDGWEFETKPDYCNSVSCPAGSFSMELVFPCKSCPNGNKDIYLGIVDKYSNCKWEAQNEILEILRQEWTIESWNDALMKKFDQSEQNELFTDSDWCSLDGITCNKDLEVVGINLSNMGITGTIPDEIGFLETLTTLDLSNNYLHGFLPSDLRFAPLNSLDLGGNKLSGIVPPMLCLKPGINGNGKGGVYDCAHIACPVGSYSSKGWAMVVGNGETCSKCDGEQFIGATSCTNADESTILVTSGVVNSDESFWGILVFLLTALTISGVVLFFVRKGSAVSWRSSQEGEEFILPSDIEITDDVQEYHVSDARESTSIDDLPDFS